MNLFKKLASLNYRKDILPLQVLKNPDKIIVLFPIDYPDCPAYRAGRRQASYDINSLIPAMKTLKSKFSSSNIIAVTDKKYLFSLRESNLFNQIISYDCIPRLFSKQFFRLRNELRGPQATISIDLNLYNDILSWLTAAPLRVGCISSSFINYRIKLKEIDDLPADKAGMAGKYVSGGQINYSVIADKIINILVGVPA